MLPDRDVFIESSFPEIQRDGYKITSHKDIKYNCIAWAADINTRGFWPHSTRSWPDSIPMEETIEAFVQFYGLFGYVVCDSSDYEIDYDKIAIFADENDIPKHAAKQINATEWSSKLGFYHDISHGLRGLDGIEYGTPKVFMRKRKASAL